MQIHVAIVHPTNKISIPPLQTICRRRPQMPLIGSAKSTNTFRPNWTWRSPTWPDTEAHFQHSSRTETYKKHNTTSRYILSLNFEYKFCLNFAACLNDEQESNETIYSAMLCPTQKHIPDTLETSHLSIDYLYMDDIRVHIFIHTSICRFYTPQFTHTHTHNRYGVRGWREGRVYRMECFEHCLNISFESIKCIVHYTI